jgi:hypothetical protein
MVDVYESEDIDTYRDLNILDIAGDLMEHREWNLDRAISAAIANYKNLKISEEVIKNEINKLVVKINKIQEELNSNQAHIKLLLEQMDGNKFKSPLHRATLCKKQLKLIVNDRSKLPLEYFQKVTTYFLDKESLNKNFKENKEIPNGCTVETYRKLIIK